MLFFHTSSQRATFDITAQLHPLGTLASNSPCLSGRIRLSTLFCPSRTSVRLAIDHVAGSATISFSLFKKHRSLFKFVRYYQSSRRRTTPKRHIMREMLLWKGRAMRALLSPPRLNLQRVIRLR